MGNAFSRRRIDEEESLELENFLEYSPLLNSSMMSQHGMKKLVKWARIATMETGEVIFKQGEKINSLYIVRSGLVRVTDKSEDTGGVVLGHGALLDAGLIRGAGPETEKRSEYITNAICRPESEVELFVISLKTYWSAMNRFRTVTESPEFKALSESALWHDLHSSDIMRIFGHCDLREYPAFAHIAKKNGLQNNRVLLCIKGSCEVTEYYEAKNGGATAGQHPIFCQAPVMINEECLMHITDERNGMVNFHKTHLITPKFRRNSQRKVKSNKFLSTVKAGPHGCVFLSLHVNSFYDRCAQSSDLFVLHLFRRLEDIEVASHAALHAERASSNAAPEAPFTPSHLESKRRDNVAEGDPESRDYINAVYESLRIKGCHYRNPSSKDVAVFRSSPWFNLRVRKRPLTRSLVDLTVEDLELHFDAVHNNGAGHELGGHGPAKGEEEKDNEFCYVKMGQPQLIRSDSPAGSHRSSNASSSGEKPRDRGRSSDRAATNFSSPLTVSNLSKLEGHLKDALHRQHPQGQGQGQGHSSGVAGERADQDSDDGGEEYAEDARKGSSAGAGRSEVAGGGALDADAPMMRMDEGSNVGAPPGKPTSSSATRPKGTPSSHGASDRNGSANTAGAAPVGREEVVEESGGLWGWGGGLFTLPGAEAEEEEEAEAEAEKEEEYDERSQAKSRHEVEAAETPPPLSRGSSTSPKSGRDSRLSAIQQGQGQGQGQGQSGAERGTRSVKERIDSGAESAEDFTGSHSAGTPRQRHSTFEPRPSDESGLHGRRDRSSSRFMRLENGSARRSSFVQMVPSSEDEATKRKIRGSINYSRGSHSQVKGADGLVSRSAVAPREKVGTNGFLFGMFDTVLCGAPEVMCGDGSSASEGVGRTPVA